MDAAIFHPPFSILHPPGSMNFPPPTERQARIIWTALTGLSIAALVGLVVVVVWGLGHVVRQFAQVLWPIAVAGVLACLLDPVVEFLTRKKVPRTRAIIMVFLMALVLLVGLLGSVVPQLVDEARQFASKVPDYKERVQNKIEQWSSQPPALLRKLLHMKPPAEPAAANLETNAVPTEIVRSTNAEPAIVFAAPSGSAFDNETLRSASDWIARFLPRVGNWLSQVLGIVGSVFGIIAGLALIPIYAFYFLLEKQGISTHWRDYLPVRDSKFKDELVFVIGSINDYLVAFFRGQVLVAMCDGVLYTIGFLIIRLPYAMLIGVMATFLTIIPFLGAITTCLTALIIALLSFGDWKHPAMVMAVFLVVQALEGTVIQPKIMGERVGLHPVTIIIALLVGTTLLGGILGGILAIPLTAVLRVLMGRYVWRRRET
jgi:predicted PurR-regulated permease PerM